MDGIKVGTILSRDGWATRILECDQDKLCESNISIPKHVALVTGQSIPGARTLNLEPPYLAYSVLQKKVNMDGNWESTWVHVCFTPTDAGYLSAHAEERAGVAKFKKEEELKEGQEQRVADLSDDLELELDEMEDLGVITIKEAMSTEKEDRLQGGK